MPREVVERWHDEIELWLQEHNLAGRTVEDVLNNGDIDERVATIQEPKMARAS